MLSRVIRRTFTERLTTAVEAKVASLEDKVDGIIHPHGYRADPGAIKETQRPELDLNERLAMLDDNVAKIEALREKARPIEEKFREMEVKYGRTGKHPSYPWFGEKVAESDRIPHTNDRLAKYSATLPNENDVTQMLGFTSDLNNPSFKSNFVQQPNREPDSNVNFEKGEVVYENKDVE
jgi:hypothetical protein